FCIILSIINTYYYFLIKDVSNPDNTLIKKKYVKYIPITIVAIFLGGFLNSVSFYLIPLSIAAFIILIINQLKLLKELKLPLKQFKASENSMASIQNSKKNIGTISLILGIIVLIGTFIREVSDDSRWNRA